MIQDPIPSIVRKIDGIPPAKELQDVFLNLLRQHKIFTTVFLINGVKLQGIVVWFDSDCLLLRRRDQMIEQTMQLVYKHAISTVMPIDTIPWNENDLPFN